MTKAPTILLFDDEPMLLSVADLETYDRTLDFRTGRLTRDILWRTPAGKRVHVRSSRMVSFTQRHLAVMEMGLLSVWDTRYMRFAETSM